MAIGDQFSGLDMKNLIGAPHGAAADASVQLAHSTADFINTVGFDKNGNTRTAVFKFNQMEKNEDGSIENQVMSVDVPLLAIVPIPNLQIDEVNVLFDMEAIYENCYRRQSQRVHRHKMPQEHPESIQFEQTMEDSFCSVSISSIICVYN